MFIDILEIFSYNIAMESNIKVLSAKTNLRPRFLKENAQAIATLQEEIAKMALSLPDKPHLEHLYINKGKAKVMVDIDESIFYCERINAILTIYSNTKVALPDTVQIDTNMKLEVDVFSDAELQESYSSYASTHPKEAQYVEYTTYFFDKQGNCAKVTRLPRDLKVNRPVIFDYDFEKDYLSEMTQEDFTLVERVLTLMKERLIDYITWSKRNVLVE